MTNKQSTALRLAWKYFKLFIFETKLAFRTTMRGNSYANRKGIRQSEVEKFEVLKEKYEGSIQQLTTKSNYIWINTINYYLGIKMGRWYRMLYCKVTKGMWLWGIIGYIRDSFSNNK